MTRAEHCRATLVLETDTHTINFYVVLGLCCLKPSQSKPALAAMRGRQSFRSGLLRICFKFSRAFKIFFSFRMCLRFWSGFGVLRPVSFLTAPLAFRALGRLVVLLSSAGAAVLLSFAEACGALGAAVLPSSAGACGASGAGLSFGGACGALGAAVLPSPAGACGASGAGLSFGGACAPLGAAVLLSSASSTGACGALGAAVLLVGACGALGAAALLSSGGACGALGAVVLMSSVGAFFCFLLLLAFLLFSACRFFPPFSNFLAASSCQLSVA